LLEGNKVVLNKVIPLAEGEKDAARTLGNRQRDLDKVQSEAYRRVEEIRGEADTKASEIYARAYNQSPQEVEFFAFTRTMETYKSVTATNTTLILSTASDLFQFLTRMPPLSREPVGQAQPSAVDGNLPMP
jgi:membrane protease subunit HflC